MRAPIILITASLLSACSYVPGTTAFKEREVMQKVREQLVDADSAKFRAFKHHPKFVCGEVNAKNSFGGFTGFLPFMLKDDGALWIYDPSERSVISSMTTINNIDKCEGKKV